jgi:uncharacterized repeat protein (TIGR01451 family)
MNYTITVSNVGTNTAGPMIVSNVLGATVGYVSNSVGGVHNSGVVTWSLPGLATGASTTVTLYVTAALAQGDFTNTALVNIPSVAYLDTNANNNATSLVALAQCAGAPPTFITSPGNQTVYANNLLSFTVVSSNVDCATPILSVAGKPSAAVFTNQSTGHRTTGYFSWTPGPSDVGTYPVRFYANNAGGATNSATIAVYVGLAGGEGENGSGVPNSQTNWHVVITNITIPAVGNATVKWESVSGVAYDVYTSTNDYGASSMSWTKEVASREAVGPLDTGTVAAASAQKYVQVVPAGFAPGEANLWAVIKPAIYPGYTLLSAPLSGSDLRMNGSFGTNLAQVLDGNNDGPGNYTGDEVFILNGDGSYSNLYLSTSNVWLTSGGSAATHQLQPGQGLLVQRNSGVIAQPRFTGPVGNLFVQTNTIPTGASIVTFSEGRYLTPGQAFSSLVSGSPVGDYDEEFADLIIFVDADGSFRPVQRLPDGTWLDLKTFTSAGYLFTPGRAAYYLRQTSGGTMKVRF